MLRPVLLGLVGLSTTSCGLVESDSRRFETLAQAVADVSLDGSATTVRTAAESGLRPAMVDTPDPSEPGALKVEVMDPHQLWDARDAGLRGAIEQAAPAIVDAAAPVVARAVMRQVPDPPRRAERVVAPVERTTLQLGAFSSPVAARAAWTRIASAGRTVSALSPSYETVQVDGRTLTRLKVVTSVYTARTVCRAADAAQLGCLRRG